MSGSKESGSKGREHEAVSRGKEAALDHELSDEAFDAYLQRGSPVSQQYGALDDAQPPEQLDANILAHAQAALRNDSAHQYRRWKRWTVPAAVAASAVIAVSIVLESGMQHEVRDAASVSMMEAESRKYSTELPREIDAAPEQPAAQAAAPSPPAPSIGVANDEPTHAQRSESNESARERYLAFDAPAPPPPQAKPSLDVPSQTVTTGAAAEQRRVGEEESAARAREQSAQRAQHELRTEQSARRSAAPAARAVAPASANRAAVDDLAAASEIVAASPPRLPEAWLEAIRDLREAGDDVEADREWRAFTAAYPSFEVAADDAARPKRSE